MEILFDIINVVYQGSHRDANYPGPRTIAYIINLCFLDFRRRKKNIEFFLS